MATIKIKTASTAQATLNYGELAIGNNELYFGNSSNLPLKLSLDGHTHAYAPTSHASSATTYGLGTTANYGHVKTINVLTQSSHSDGTALSAYQGYLLNQNKAPTSHASSATTYGLGTTTTYGHVKTINALTQSSHSNGTALSAYQGYLLNQNKAPIRPTVTSVASSRNFSEVDENNVLRVTGSAVTLTIPASTFNIGTQITVLRDGTGTVTITAGTSVYLNGVLTGSTTITTRYKAITLVMYASNYWVALGN